MAPVAIRLVFAAFGVAWLAPALHAQQQQPRPPACTSPEHRQFDFWVGSWNVYRTGTETQVARSLVERLYDGCAIRENWMPLSGSGGGSLNAYRPSARVWRQAWTDGGNGWGAFEGGLADGKMVLTGRWEGMNGPGTVALVRMTYSREPGGAVRQLGETSDDDGRSWKGSFDLTYRPAAAGGS